MQDTLQIIRNQFAFFKRPESEPWFPEDITLSTDTEVGLLMSLYTVWTNHVNEQLAFDEARLHGLKEELRIEEAKELIKLNANDDKKRTFASISDRQAYILTRDHIQNKVMLIASMTSIVKLQKAVAENFENRFNAASREITRRTLIK